MLWLDEHQGLATELLSLEAQANIAKPWVELLFNEATCNMLFSVADHALGFVK